jgi:hypothetical protein
MLIQKVDDQRSSDRRGLPGTRSSANDWMSSRSGPRASDWMPWSEPSADASSGGTSIDTR